MMESMKLSLSRGTFNVRDRGNTDGIPLVMLHGWPENSYCWEAVTPFLREDFRVIAPDLRGLGESERTLDPRCYQKRELSQDVIEIIDHLGVKSFFLVGHDWGGTVAQEVALAIPERTRRLVLMNIYIINNRKGNAEGTGVMQADGSFRLWYQYFQQQRGLAEALIPGNEDVWIRYFFGRAGREGKVSEKALAEYIRCYAIKDTPATGAFYYRAMREDRKRWDELAGTKFSMPSLYIYGNKDVVIIREYLNHIDECFNDIKVVEVETEHFLQEEQPETVADILNDFLVP